METTPAQVVAEKILEGIANGVEEIFPDTMAEQVGPAVPQFAQRTGTDPCCLLKFRT